MVSIATPDGAQAIGRAFDLFEAIVLDSGETPLSELGAGLGLAGSTTRRYAKLLLDRGLVTRIARGRYAGSRKLHLLLENIDPLARLVAIARPILSAAANREGATAHLGIYDNEMVTYLVRAGRPSIFTRERAQLEAYCTGIGKALLSLIPRDELDRYLQLPMVKLTPTTIVEPEAIRDEVAAIRARGYAIDNGEMQSGLVCLAVPLGEIEERHCAVSFSYSDRRIEDMDLGAIIARLRSCADRIGARIQRAT